MPSSPNFSKQLWRRAAASAKDTYSVCLAHACVGRYHRGGVLRNRELEAAIIKATSHDDVSIDYRNVTRVLTWLRISPSSSLDPLMLALSQRVERTKDWVVALKGLMLAHGVLLCSREIPGLGPVGRIPFDLSGFRDRSTDPGKSMAVTAFVRAYYEFLDHRSRFLGADDDNSESVIVTKIERMQDLLDLLMQVRPYGDGMGLPLILEAMDCVIIEIFEVYSVICDGIARSLVSLFASPPAVGADNSHGMVGVSILRRAREQSSQLSSYFQLCRELGVVNAAQLPEIEMISERDIEELERMLTGHGTDSEGEEETAENSSSRRRGMVNSMKTVVTKNWVMFKDDLGNSGSGVDRNPFLRSQLELQQTYRHQHRHSEPVARRETLDLLSM